MDRREFLKLVGIGSTTLITSCKKDPGKLMHFLIPAEEDITPGNPIFFNSTCTECPANCGILVKAYEKLYNNENKIYPVKLEGIKNHPVNDGAICIRGQASLTRVYHPDRIKNPLIKDSDGNFKEVGWNDVYLKILNELKKSDRKNVYLSSRTTGSISKLIDDFCSKMNIERLPEFEFFHHSAIKEANRILFNKKDIPFYNIENSDFLLSVGVDLFETFVSPVSYANQWRRAKRNTNFKWFHIEPHVSITGLQADKRFIINPCTEIYLLIFLIKNVLNDKFNKEILKHIPDISLQEISNKTGISNDNLNKISKEFLKANRQLLIVGGVSTSNSSGLEISVLAGLIQWVSGMLNSVIDFSRTENYSRVGSMIDIEKLSNRLQNKEIGVIFISKLNSALPAFFMDSIKKANFRILLTDFPDNVMKECDIILPLSHSLESWGDTEPRSGIRTIIQPVMKPIFNTLSEGDILLQIMKKSSKNFQEYLFSKWWNNYGKNFKKEFFNKGYYEEYTLKEKVKINENSVISFLKYLKLQNTISLVPNTEAKPVLLVIPSIRAYDGRSNVLQLLNEIPDPLTTISYGDWISISEKTAKKLMLEDKDEIEISSVNFSVKLPIKIQPMLSEDIYMVQLHMLNKKIFQIDSRTGESILYLDNIKIVKTGRKIPIPILSGSFSQKDRGIIPSTVDKKIQHKYSLYPEHKHKDYRWVMVIDFDLCIGCSACIASCYIENNIPVVGFEEHLKGREMSWIRVEPYYEENQNPAFLLMLCQHCDNAPCEPVCPVYATYHNPEGLNAQVYNRCVGTRYCSNNCPYKVRRFNWLNYEYKKTYSEMFNPEVSIREKGIMEKCTFCIQRIRKAKDYAKDEKRKIKDGELIPACAETCPTNAIAFGNILDKESKVYKLVNSERVYRVLEHLGIEPAVYYLRKRS